MAKRIGLKKEKIKYLKDNELKQAIFKKEIDRKIIRKRQGYYAIGALYRQFFLFYGHKAKLLEKKYFPPIKISVKEITGILAQKG